MWHVVVAIVASVVLAGCTEITLGSHLWKKGTTRGQCVAEGALKVGNPYLINGERYVPIPSSLGFNEKGIASWYGDDFHGKPTANGECYNMYAFTAAHRTLPLPTIVRVTNLENNRSVVVKVNDRGPFARGRVIDMSYAAAQSLGMVRNGTAPVLVEAIGGPHHVPGGRGMFAGKERPSALAAMRRDYSERGATLPSYSPGSMAEEDLLNEPAINLPPPPPVERRTYSSRAPLTQTRVVVQAGAFADATRARAVQAQAEQLGVVLKLDETRSAGRVLYRVRSAPFGTLAEAEAAMNKLTNGGLTGAQIKVED